MYISASIDTAENIEVVVIGIGGGERSAHETTVHYGVKQKQRIM